MEYFLFGVRSCFDTFSHNHGNGKLLCLKGILEGPIFDFHDYGTTCYMLFYMDKP